MEIKEKFLPIGTVVMLKNGKKRVMITGFCAVTKDNKDKIWDYSGCMYPEGFLNSNQTCLFDHSQIEKIYYLGLSDDDEERAFKEKLNEIGKQLQNGVGKQEQNGVEKQEQNEAGKQEQNGVGKQE